MTAHSRSYEGIATVFRSFSFFSQLMYRFLFFGLFILQANLLECRGQNRFGEMNRLSEKLIHQKWQTHLKFSAAGGVSLIGSQWRALAWLNLEAARYPFGVRMSGNIRQGPLGRYTPDWDEAYDVLRLIQFVRIQTDHLYARIGSIRDMRHGIGHIVNHYNSSTSWDSRTIGVELAWAGKILKLNGFSSDLLLNNLVGARASLDLPSVGILGVNYANHTPTNLEAWSLDLQHPLFETGRIVFAPYISYAWYTEHGDGLAFGADISSSDFLDLLSFKLRVGAFYSSRHFIPGYIGTLFSVSNPQNRIVRSDADLNNIVPEDYSGIVLRQARGVNDLLTEFQLQIRESFWIAYSWRRHFGAQPLSELYFRLFMRGGAYFNLEVGIDRLGERKFLDVFSPFSEQSALTFATDVNIRKSIFLRVEARYTFEPVESSLHYLVQRRFEPTLGLRTTF